MWPAQEIEHDRSIEIRAAEAEPEKKTDPFDEIDLGSYFQDYLDPGFRTANNFEISEAPSIENFLSQPSNADRPHLLAAGFHLTFHRRFATQRNTSSAI